MKKRNLFEWYTKLFKILYSKSISKNSPVSLVAQLAGAVEYTNCTAAMG